MSIPNLLVDRSAQVIPESSIARFLPVIALYLKPNMIPPLSFTPSDTNITISDGNGDLFINYVSLSIQDVVNSINSNSLCPVFAVKLIDIGDESMTQSSLSIDINDIGPDGCLLIRYLGFAARYQETSVIQLKPPTTLNPIMSWYPRIGRGTVRARFSDTTFTNYYGINPSATYTFSIPEFINQDWSLKYGPPYKDVYGELAKVTGYNSVLGASVIKLSNGPIYWRNNISIQIKGIRQPGSIIRYVDENNKLIYLNSKIGSETQVKVDYSYLENDYLYDGIDLNVTISHNPIIIDSYIAFYIKPSSADGALVSGGNTIFHEVVNTSLAARAKTARLIESTTISSKPIYEPIMYLGSINVRQSQDYQNIEVIDTRSRGGGLYPDSIDKFRSSWKDVNTFWDIGNMAGIPIPGNASVVINIPQSVIDAGMSYNEARNIVSKNVSLGIAPIVDVT